MMVYAVVAKNAYQSICAFTGNSIIEKNQPIYGVIPADIWYYWMPIIVIMNDKEGLDVDIMVSQI